MHYLLIIVSYLVGSIPFGLLLSKSVGVDVRRAGSGNIGATNVARLLGRKLGAVTLLADMAKGLLPMVVASLLFTRTGLSGDRALWVVFCGGAAFLGHLFPLYLKFKGGKGVATALGVFLYLSPLAVVFNLVVFIAVVYGSGYVSVGSLVVAALMPLLIWFLDGSTVNICLAAFVGLFIWLRHRDNLERLLNHQEKSWKNKGTSETPGES